MSGNPTFRILVLETSWFTVRRNWQHLATILWRWLKYLPCLFFHRFFVIFCHSILSVILFVIFCPAFRYLSFGLSFCFSFFCHLSFGMCFCLSFLQLFLLFFCSVFVVFCVIALSRCHCLPLFVPFVCHFSVICHVFNAFLSLFLLFFCHVVICLLFCFVIFLSHCNFRLFFRHFFATCLSFCKCDWNLDIRHDQKEDKKKTGSMQHLFSVKWHKDDQKTTNKTTGQDSNDKKITKHIIKNDKQNDRQNWNDNREITKATNKWQNTFVLFFLSFAGWDYICAIWNQTHVNLLELCCHMWKFSMTFCIYSFFGASILGPKRWQRFISQIAALGPSSDALLGSCSCKPRHYSVLLWEQRQVWKWSKSKQHWQKLRWIKKLWVQKLGVGFGN